MNTPHDACDAHLHFLSEAAVKDYLEVQRRIGTSRAVPVQSKHFGTDNMCLLEALATLGPNGRGIAVVQPSVGDQELRRLNEGSIRGLRFSLWNPVDAVTTIDMIEPLAMRIAELGWHVQLHMSADQIVASTALLARLPCPIVFDHMGRLPPSVGSRHPAFAVIMRLVDRGRAWVKLSGAYLNTRLGPPYADTTPIASAYVKAAPERLVWGSDWPHVTESHKPDARQLLDLLGEWASDEITRTKILVDNPAKLYGFV